MKDRAVLFLRLIVRKLLNSRWFLRAEANLDYVILVGRGHQSRASDKSITTIMATLGSGNIGDVAMLESCIQNFDPPVTVCVSSNDSFPNLAIDFPDVSVVVLPGLVDGRPTRRPRSVLKFAKVAQSTSSFVVIGADVMDGSYSRREAFLRLRAVSMAVKAGATARVGGFSWSPSSDDFIDREVARLGDACNFLLRDPVSLSRFEDATGIHGVLVSDLVFSWKPAVPSEVLTMPNAWGDRAYTVVNISGLLMARLPGYLDAMALVVEHLLSSGRRVVLLPHVIRDGDNDLEACRIIHSRHDSDRLMLIDHLMTPSAVVALLGGADRVVTSRMHLAILSLKNGLAPIVVSSQGKVAGLMRLFDVPQLEIDPVDDMAEAILGFFDPSRATEELDRKVQDLLPEVVKLASSNFVAMPG